MATRSSTCPPMSECLNHGVLMIPCGRYTNVMHVMPSLTIPRSLMFKALNIFGDGLASLTEARPAC